MKMKFYQKVLILPVLVLLWSALVPCVAASGEDSFIIPQTKLTNSEDESGGGKFGSSVAIDGSTLGVGAILADGGAVSSGAAYLFRISDSNDFPQIKLTESDDPHNYDYFGNSLDIIGNALVIGASRDDINGTDSGAAYVMRFSYDENTWTISKQTRLTPTEPSAADQFGYSVAISDNRVVVGTYKAEAVYVFDDNGSGWDEKAKLSAGDAQGGEKFGSSVAIDGDTLVVGAIKGGNGYAQTGSAYVFHYDGYAWVEEAKLVAADLGDSDKFGYSVAIEGDTIIVGAPYHDDGESNSGAAYVFRLNAGHWLEVAKLTGSELFENAYFGNSVALSGNTAVVGAYKNDLLDKDNNLLVDAGSAHLFRFDGSGWPEKEKLIPYDVEAGDEFGCAVAISGDTVVVGAHKEGDLAGSAYIFTLALENQPPVANAGENMEVEEGDLVVLDGSLSEDPDGVILTYEWVQKLTDDEPLVELDLSNPVYPTFIAPALNPKCTTFTFELRVTDDKGLTSEPAKVEVKVLPNNRIYSKLRGKHPRWPTWHKYTFEGFKDEVVTITLEADPSGWNHGKGVTLMLKDKIWGVWFREAARGDLPKTLTAKLPADGQYAVYVVKKPWFRRGNSFSGHYILTVEGTCGKLRKSSW
jgi:hypothetical protein